VCVCVCVCVLDFVARAQWFWSCAAVNTFCTSEEGLDQLHTGTTNCAGTTDWRAFTSQRKGGVGVCGAKCGVIGHGRQVLNVDGPVTPKPC